MLKRDYLLAALNAGSYLYKSWVIDCFGTVNFPVKNTERRPKGKNPIVFPEEPKYQPFEEYPYQLFVENDNVVFFDPKTNEWDVLQGAELHQPPFRFKDTIELQVNDLVNVDRPLKTLIGNVLVNQTVLCHSFGNRIPFVTGEVKVGKIEDIIASKLETPPEEVSARLPDKIYTDELERRYYPAVYSMTGWCQLAAPAATPYTIVGTPGMAELRKRLFDEYRDQLDDPATVAKIMGILIKHDVEFQNLDPEKGFLRPGTKDFDIVRAKAVIAHGIEYDFNDRNKITVIENPLSEGWDITKLPQMANSLIDGSFNRGAMTALGGEAAKFIGRFFLNTVIAEDDCGSQLGIDHLVTKENAAGFHWAYFFNEQGQLTLFTPEDEYFYIGKTLTFRSPQYCHTKDGNFCVACIGKRFENSRTALGSLATEAGSVIMGIQMGAMHGRSLKTEKWDWNSALK